MAKKRIEKTPAAAAPPAIVDARPVDAATVFSFPSVVRCPRCGALDTVQTATKGDTQYRRCRAPICRWNFKVRGTLA